MRAFAKPTGENLLSQHPQRVRQSELGISPTMKEFQNGKERRVGVHLLCHLESHACHWVCIDS